MVLARISTWAVLALAAVVPAQTQITELLGHNNAIPSYQSAPAGMAAQPTAAPLVPLVPAATAGVVAPTAAPVAMPGVAMPGAAAGNPMATLLSSITSAAANQGPTGTAGAPMINGHQHMNSAQLSQDAMAVVSGLVETFMHKMVLLPGERSCLERNMATLSADIMGTVGDIVTAVKALIEGNGKVEKEATGGVMSAGIDSAMKITSLVASSTQMVKDCVHGDALAMLNETAHHLINGTYLEHRFIANGVDIARALADSVTAFEAHDFHRFGADVGMALRKVALSSATNGTKLPEGVPDEVIIQKAFSGLMRGFFATGSELEITDTAHPNIDIDVDLHQCVAGNADFFKELWMATWDLIAQISVNAEQHGAAGITEMFNPPAGQGQPKWSGELMIAMMQFPTALSNCGVSLAKKNMLMDAIKTLPQLHAHFSLPHDRVGAQQATSNMAQAVVAWSNWNFEQFGYDLGKLFRELIMMSFPQKYAVDTSGRLRLNAEIDAMKLNQKSGLVSASVIIGGAAMCLLVALAVVRTRKTAPRLLLDHRTAVTDIEDGEDEVE